MGTDIMQAAQQAQLQPCWSCKGPVSSHALFCATCTAVQGPGVVDHFARLGLARGFEVNVAELDRQYFDFQRRLHPDRFANRTARERALSQSQAVAFNEAYETLKDPLRRAAYLLRLCGHALEIDSAATITDPALLMEAMEMREALAQAETREEVTALCAKADQDVLHVQCELSTSFAKGDLEQAAHLTTRLKYLTKLADEARARRARMTRPTP